MENRRNIAYSIAGGALGLILVAFAIAIVIKRPYTSKLPEVPGSTNQSQVVREQIEAARKKARQKPSAENLGNLGMVYHSSANYQEAALCYQLALKKDESAWLWNYYLGHLSIEMGDSDAIIENFSRVLKIFPDAQLAWYYLGLEYKNRRDFDQAESSFGKIAGINSQDETGRGSSRVDQFPLGTYARFQLARTYFDKGRMDLAEESLMEILELSNMFGPAFRLLGNIYSIKGDISLSRKYGTRANDLKIFTPPVDVLMDEISLLSRSELYLLKKIDEAVKSIHPRWALKLIQNGMKYFPDNKDLISKAVNVSLWTNSLEIPYAYMNQHMSMFSDNFEELFGIGMLYFQKDLYQPANQYLSAALGIRPMDLEAQKNLAISLWREGAQEQALALLNEIISTNPDNLEVLADVTDIMFFELSQGTRAIDYLVLLDHFLPSDPKVQKVKAWIAENNGRTREAIELYEASFMGDRDDFTTIKNLGSLLTREKMWEKAINHFREALEHHPNEQYFLERLGTLLITCPDASFINADEGREYAERAFFHYKGQSSVTVYAGKSLAMAYSMLGDREKALRTINMSITLARSENFPAEDMALMEELAKQL